MRNSKGEKVVITYDAVEQTIDFDRRRSGDVSFSEAFPCIVTSPTYGQIKTLRIFVDRSSIEIFDADGKMAMTNLVFPSDPYNKLVVKGKAIWRSSCCAISTARRRSSSRTRPT